jgi:hypothetical protein
MVERDEVQSRRPRESRRRVGVFSCGEAGGGRIRADPAEEVELGGTACDGGGARAKAASRWFVGEEMKRQKTRGRGGAVFYRR